MAYAATDIRFGDEDGEVTEYAAGDEVDRSLFTDEQWARMVKAGALTTKAPVPPEEDEEDALLAIETRPVNEQPVVPTSTSELPGPGFGNTPSGENANTLESQERSDLENLPLDEVGAPIQPDSDTPDEDAADEAGVDAAVSDGGDD